MKQTAPHLQYQTRLSREGRIDMSNRKPYRSKDLKALAKKLARRGQDGSYHSSVLVLFHAAVR